MIKQKKFRYDGINSQDFVFLSTFLTSEGLYLSPPCLGFIDFISPLTVPEGRKGIAFDNSEKMIEIAKKKLSKYDWKVFTVNAENTKLPSSKFDLIIAWDIRI